LPHTELSIVHIPGQVVARFIQLPAKEGQYAFILLEHVLRHYLPRFYHGFEIVSTHAVRVTRDAEFGLVRRRDQDLLMTIEQGIRERRIGDAVRLHYDPDLPSEVLRQLIEELELTQNDLYAGKGFTAFTDLFQLYAALNIPRLKDTLAPTGLREHFIDLIRNEAEQARAGKAARIIAKLNSLIDESVVEELYAASEAGVQIDLLMRGMCSLRPAVAGVSERIRVISIVDRYLEHARVFYFHNGGNPTFWLASADWMPRNFKRRIEIAFRIPDPQLQTKLKDILELQLVDSVKAWQMKPDGSYVRKPSTDGRGFRFQERFYEMLRAEEISGSSKSITVDGHDFQSADDIAVIRVPREEMPQNDSFRHSEGYDENLAREPAWVQTAWCTFRAKSDRLAAGPAMTQIFRCARIQKPATKAVAPSAPRSHSIP
jgi:polyphosphate kinase